MFVSDKNAYSKSHTYLSQICNQSVSLEYANCIKMMFHSKADKKGSEPSQKIGHRAVAARAACVLGLCKPPGVLWSSSFICAIQD